MVDLDIYRTANLLIRDHGDQATIEAAQRADAKLDNGDLEELPLTYMPGGAVRLRAKAVGDLTTSKT